MAETEAKRILESCSSVMETVEYDREEELVKHLQSQVDTSVAEMNRVVEEAKAKRPEIQNIITGANQNIEHIRQFRTEAEDTINRLTETLTNLTNTIREGKAKLDSDMVQAQKSIEVALSHLHELDEGISQAKQRVEACLFIRDMASAQKTLLKSGKISLLEKDDLGNWAVKQTWTK